MGHLVQVCTQAMAWMTFASTRFGAQRKRAQTNAHRRKRLVGITWRARRVLAWSLAPSQTDSRDADAQRYERHRFGRFRRGSGLQLTIVMAAVDERYAGPRRRVAILADRTLKNGAPGRRYAFRSNRSAQSSRNGSHAPPGQNRVLFLCSARLARCGSRSTKALPPRPRSAGEKGHWQTVP